MNWLLYSLTLEPAGCHVPLSPVGAVNSTHSMAMQKIQVEWPIALIGCQ